MKKSFITAMILASALLCSCSSTDSSSEQPKTSTTTQTNSEATTTTENVSDNSVSDVEHEHILSVQPNGKYYLTDVGFSDTHEYTYDKSTGVVLPAGKNSSTDPYVEVYYEKTDDNLVFTANFVNNTDKDIVAKTLLEALTLPYEPEFSTTAPGQLSDDNIVEIKSGDTYTITKEVSYPTEEMFSSKLDPETKVSYDDYYAQGSLLFYITEPDSLSDYIIDMGFSVY